VLWLVQVTRRVTLLVNVWLNHKPEYALALPAAVCAQLMPTLRYAFAKAAMGTSARGLDSAVRAETCRWLSRISRNAEGGRMRCTALRCTALHCTALHCTALHCAALRCAALHSRPCCETSRYLVVVPDPLIRRCVCACTETAMSLPSRH
jgi:hypothetical protein